MKQLIKWLVRNIKIVAAVAALVTIMVFAIKSCREQGEIAKQEATYRAFMDERSQYASELPDIIRERLSFDKSVGLTVETEDRTTTLKDSTKMYFLYDKMTVTMHDIASFDRLDDEAKYKFVKDLCKRIIVEESKARKDYDLISMSGTEREKKTGHYLSHAFRVNVKIYHGSMYYSYTNTVDVLYYNNNELYNPSKVEKGTADSTTGKGGIYGPDVYDNMWADPDDYDDSDEYADDAEGWDFDDYDEAYDYWENW